jgi:hypothetical protein
MAGQTGPLKEAGMAKLYNFSDYTFIAASPRRRGISRHVARVLVGIRDGGEMQARYEQLAHSDLAKHGLTRDDIIRVVLTGRK